MLSTSILNRITIETIRRAFLEIKDKRKLSTTRAKLITISTDTYACQTCFIPIMNYFRVPTRLKKRLTFLTLIIRKLYISQRAPLITLGTCVWSVQKVRDKLNDHFSKPPNKSVFKHRIEALEISEPTLSLLPI